MSNQQPWPSPVAQLPMRAGTQKFADLEKVNAYIAATEHWMAFTQEEMKTLQSKITQMDSQQQPLSEGEKLLQKIYLQYSLALENEKISDPLIKLSSVLVILGTILGILGHDWASLSILIVAIIALMLSSNANWIRMCRIRIHPIGDENVDDGADETVSQA